MTDYKITKKQRSYLDSLVCQRVSDDPANKEMIRNFTNEFNPGIAAALRQSWNQDSQDKLAYYIVKDPELEMPLFFFSLKCGEIHIPLAPEKLDSAVKSGLMLMKAASEKCDQVCVPRATSPWEQYQLSKMAREAIQMARDVAVDDWAREVIEKQLVEGKLPEEGWAAIWKRIFSSLDKQNIYKDEIQVEGENIIRTRKNFPSVELTHFCAYDSVGYLPDLTGEARRAYRVAHDPVQKRWDEMGMGNQNLGKTMFWNFVEPKIREIRDLVGCEYIYLFAADGHRNGHLTSYYKSLGFDFRDDIHVAKPSYDFCCFFMCQEVKTLRNQRNAFFRAYNAPK